MAYFENIFRHFLQVEGSIGYAHWVTETLRDKARLSQELFLYSIQHMAAIPAAADAMAKYTGLSLFYFIFSSPGLAWRRTQDTW